MTNLTIPQDVWDHEVTEAVSPPISWLWHGFVAQGNLTLLTSQWKAGKTTLLSLLLARRKQGGQLAGLAVNPGKSVVVSEEPLSLWADRARRYGFGGQVCFLSQPFRAAFRSPRNGKRCSTAFSHSSRSTASTWRCSTPSPRFCVARIRLIVSWRRSCRCVD